MPNEETSGWVNVINTTKGIFGKKGSKQNAAMGATVGGLIGSIFPGVGNAIGAALGGLIGAMIGNGTHDKTDTKKVIKQEIASREKLALNKYGVPKNDSQKLLVAIYLRRKFNDLRKHAVEHGNNSIAKSSKEHHKARRKTYEDMIAEFDKEIKQLAAKHNGKVGSNFMNMQNFKEAAREAHREGRDTFVIEESDRKNPAKNGGKKPIKTAEKVGMVVSGLTGLATVANGLIKIFKR